MKTPDPVLWDEQDDTAFKALKEFNESSAFGYLNCQIPFFLSVYKKGMPLGYSPKSMGTAIEPEGILASSGTLWHRDNPLGASTATALWLKSPRKSVGSP